MTKKKTVELDAHKIVTKPTEIEFTTKKGEKVDFVAKKNVKEPVHVKLGRRHTGDSTHGSYRNRTNLRKESDVDFGLACALLTPVSKC